jgi:diguanylate cyclase (GGDEF)-like protein
MRSPVCVDISQVMKNNDTGIRLLAIWGRISAVILTIILLSSAVFSPWAARATSADATNAQRLTMLNQDLDGVASAVNQEDAYLERFVANPSPSTDMMFRDSSADVDDDLGKIVQDGPPLYRNSASQIVRLHDDYVDRANFLMAAESRHRPALEISALDQATVDPSHIQTVMLMTHMSAQVDRAIGVAEATSRRTIRFIAAMSIARSFIGLIFLGVFFYILESYRRRTAEVHRAELERLEEAAHTDNLTSLGNHRAFQEDLRRDLARASRHAEALSLAIIDVDDLKVVNDSSGHQRGDEVLVLLASLLKGLRADDRAFRIGGDEFAVILAKTNEIDAREAMERLRRHAERKLGGVTVSIGVATAMGDDIDSEIVRSQADAALFAAKRGGRNSVEDFDGDKDGMWLLSSAKVRSLRQIIADGEMGVAFQPIWDVDRGDVLAYEALARPAAKYGFRGPQDIFDLAQRTGRSHELDAVTRDAILARARELPENALLFINLCPQSLTHKGFDGQNLARLVARAGLTPDRVVIEITERSIVSFDTLISAALDLRRFGFRLALDDTGAGNSGLELLSKLPLDFVKIDRMILVNAVNDAGARGVLAGIITIARAIGAYVIAEGVENEQMLKLACGAQVGSETGSRGVRGVQGYLLRRPAETFPERPEIDAVRALLNDVTGRSARPPDEFAVGARGSQPAHLERTAPLMLVPKQSSDGRSNVAKLQACGD